MAADKPSAMEQMAMGFLSRMIGLNPEQMRQMVQGIGGGITDAAKRLERIEGALARIEARLAAADAAGSNPLFANGHDPERAGDGVRTRTESSGA